MQTIAIDPKSKSVVLGDFRTKAFEIYETPVGVAASFELANGIVMLAGLGTNVTGSVWLDAWTGTPGDSDGVAIEGSDEPVGWLVIPLCSCGIRGCGNSGKQFAGPFSAVTVSEIIATLEALPQLGALQENQLIGDRWDPIEDSFDNDREANYAVLRALNFQ